MSAAGSGGYRSSAGADGWLAGGVVVGLAGSGRVGVGGWGWSVTGTLVFLVSIGPDLTFRLFFDGMLGDRRCAGGVGIVFGWSLLWWYSAS